MVYNAVITTEDIYGVENITIPKGWEFKRFGVVKTNEHFLSIDETVVLGWPRILSEGLVRVIVQRENTPVKFTELELDAIKYALTCMKREVNGNKADFE